MPTSRGRKKKSRNHRGSPISQEPRKLPPQSQPQPQHSLGQAVWGWTKWTVATLIVIFGVIGGVVGIWGRFWPTDPDIHPRDSSSLVLPFTIRNVTGFVHINEPHLRCGVDFVYAEDSAGQTVVITDAAFVSGFGPSISPGDSIVYTCNASDLLQPRANGTLSLFGSSTKLAVYGSDQPIIWHPPFRILKMCVWIGGEYRWAGRNWQFTSKIFQWPASPNSLQWIEGPIAYAGRDADPFSGLKKPTRAFGSRKITDDQGNLRPDAFQCSPAVRFPYALVTGPGSAMLVMP
jgi:hypothetical protein